MLDTLLLLDQLQSARGKPEILLLPLPLATPTDLCFPASILFCATSLERNDIILNTFVGEPLRPPEGASNHLQGVGAQRLARLRPSFFCTTLSTTPTSSWCFCGRTTSASGERSNDCPQGVVVHSARLDCAHPLLRRLVDNANITQFAKVANPLSPRGAVGQLSARC